MYVEHMLRWVHTAYTYLDGALLVDDEQATQSHTIGGQHTVLLGNLLQVRRNQEGNEKACRHASINLRHTLLPHSSAIGLCMFQHDSGNC